MQKLLRSSCAILLVGIVSLFFIAVARAQTVAPPPGAPTTSLTYTVNPLFVNDQSAVIFVRATTTSLSPGTLQFSYGTGPGNMTGNFPLMFYNPAVYTPDPNIQGPQLVTPVNTDLSLNFPTLQSDTTYFIEAKDTSLGITFPPQTFTTYPQGLGGWIEFLASGFTLTFPPSQQQITETSATLTANIVAKTKAGNSEFTLLMGTGLQGANMLTPSSAPSCSHSYVLNQPQECIYTLNGLTPGTVYWVALRQKGTSKVSTPIPFVTKGALVEDLPVNTGFIGGTEDVTTNMGDSGSFQVEDPFDGSGIVPCDVGCGWNDLITLIGNIIDYILVILIPAVAVVCIYAGASFIFSRGNPAKLEAAKKLLGKVVVATAVILLAWVIVAGVYTALIPEGELTKYVLLDIFQ